METKIREEILKLFGNEYFTTETVNGIPEFAQNGKRFVTLYVSRETVGPLIDRSDDPESTISHVMSVGDGTEKEVVEIPARKFKSKEKLMGLKICRSFGVVDPSYEYNGIREKAYLNNPNSVIFGDTVVEGGEAGQAMLPARVFYSSSYSITGKQVITKKLTHNALSEAGTMWDSYKGANRTSLFNTEYVVPGVVFPSFITMHNPTPEALVHMVLSLKERSYGAQTSITGPNVYNRIAAIYAGPEELPITSYTVSRDLKVEESLPYDTESFRNSVDDHVIAAMNTHSSGVSIYGQKLANFLSTIDSLGGDELSSVYKKLYDDAKSLIDYAGIIKKGKKKGASNSAESE